MPSSLSTSGQERPLSHDFLSVMMMSIWIRMDCCEGRERKEPTQTTSSVEDDNTADDGCVTTL